MEETNKRTRKFTNSLCEKLNIMKFIKDTKKYKVKMFYLRDFLNNYWFIPSDVLQRSIEANIWDMCNFRRPILEIGIGNGEISAGLFKKHNRIDVGIDRDNSGLETARATNKYNKVLCINAENMPFKEASFNTVVSNSSFEHIIHDLEAISEVGRVLKKGGYFFMTVPSVYLPKWILSYEEKINKNTIKEKLKSFNNRTQHFHYRSFLEWEKIFLKNNLSILFHNYYFSRETVFFWYKLFKIFTYTLNKRELWSYIGHSKISHFIPKKVIINLLEKRFLKDIYKNAFFTNSKEGGQLFIVAQKK